VADQDSVDPLAEPARVAFAGDWHGNAVYAREAIEYAADHSADVVVHLGDFGYQFRPAFLRAVGKALTDTGIRRLLFVDGNHEDHRWLARRPAHPSGLRSLGYNIWHLPRGFRWRWAGLRWLALGGAHSVDAGWRRQTGALWQTEEHISAEQATAVISGGPTDILLSHDCPHGVDIPGLQPGLFDPHELFLADAHRQLLRALVDQVRPARIWHGHYHTYYQQAVSFDWPPPGPTRPAVVTGLDCDGSALERNITVVNVAALAAAVHDESVRRIGADEQVSP
jgi:predicted phosphodiesterase